MPPEASPNAAAGSSPPSGNASPAADAGLRLLDLPLGWFGAFAALVLAALVTGALPGGMVGAFALMLPLGVLCEWGGNRLPIVKDYLGGGAILAIFVPAGLATYQVLPADVAGNVKTFMGGGGFLDFFICALVTGSILGMERRLLISAVVGYLPAILGCVICALGLTALGGWLSGYGAREAVLFVGLPIIGGGLGAGAVPLAKIFGEGVQRSPTEMLSIMMPAVALGNALSIVGGGLLDRLGRAWPALTGNGQLIRRRGVEVVTSLGGTDARDEPRVLAGGLFLAVAFFSWGQLMGKWVPSVHPYAWMILTVAAVKYFGVLPASAEVLARAWFRFVMNHFTAVLLVGIGIAYTDLGQVVGALTPQYLLLVVLAVLGAAIGSGLVGYWVGFYPVESALSAGLCMSNMGGTGDVAVLSAARRMDLMPFAQISSRLGGAIILILASVMLRILP